MEREQQLIQLLEEKRNIIKANTRLANETSWDYAYWSYVYENDEIQKEIVSLEKELSKIRDAKTKELCPHYYNILELNNKKLSEIRKRYEETIKGLEKFKPSGYKQKITLIKEVMGISH